MNDETPVSPESAAPESPPPNAAPEAYREYVKWRTTGELPATDDQQQQQPAAADDDPPAKTEPESGTGEAQDDEEGERETGRRGGSRQRRIDRLTAENELLRRQLAQQQQPAPAQEVQQPANDKPRLENFPTLEAYQEALTDWNITQREARREAQAAQKAAEEAEQKIQADWQSKQKAARKAHPDYDEVIEATAAPEGPGVMAARQAMLEDEAGAEILYHLATNPKEMKRIASLPPIAAVREIGRLSAALSPTTPPVNGRRITAAPKPPPPASRPAQAASDSIHDPAVQADYRRYEQARRAQIKGK